MVIQRHIFMLLLLNGAVSLGQSPTQTRQFDFKNFSYPWGGPSDWTSQLVWLDISESEHIRLVNGLWKIDTEDDEHLSFRGLTLEAVQYVMQGDDPALGEKGREQVHVFLCAVEGVVPVDPQESNRTVPAPGEVP